MTDPLHGAEPRQPGEQRAIAGRGRRELGSPEEPPESIERGGDVGVLVGVHAPDDDLFFQLRGHSHRVPSSTGGIGRTRPGRWRTGQ